MWDEETLKCLQIIEPPTDNKRILVGSLYLIFTTMSMLLNILYLIICFFIWRTLKSNVIYLLLLSLSVVNVIYLLCNYLLLIPCTYSTCQFYNDLVVILLGVLNTLGYYGELFINFTIAVMRIVYFADKKFFDHKGKSWFVLLFPWFISALVVIITNSVGCYKRYVIDQLNLSLLLLVCL